MYTAYRTATDSSSSSSSRVRCGRRILNEARRNFITLSIPSLPFFHGPVSDFYIINTFDSVLLLLFLFLAAMRALLLIFRTRLLFYSWINDELPLPPETIRWTFSVSRPPVRISIYNWCTHCSSTSCDEQIIATATHAATCIFTY